MSQPHVGGKYIDSGRRVIMRLAGFVKNHVRRGPMDMSKLPRLSNTRDAHPPPPADALPPPVVQTVSYAQPESSVGAEVWLSGILGIVFMLLGKTFAIWFFT